MNNIKELLPIGSIVLLKDGEKKLMITGVLQTDNNDAEKVYDYLGILYPEGNIGEGFQFLFNHEDIETTVFRGYEDEERGEFIKKLNSLYEETDDADEE